LYHLNKQVKMGFCGWWRSHHPQNPALRSVEM